MLSCPVGLQPIATNALLMQGGVDVPQPAPDVVPSPPPVPPHSPSTPPEIIEPPLPEPRPPVRDPIVPGEIRTLGGPQALARC